MSEDKALKAATQAVARLKYDNPKASAQEIAQTAIEAAKREATQTMLSDLLRLSSPSRRWEFFK